MLQLLLNPGLLTGDGYVNGRVDELGTEHVIYSPANWVTLDEQHHIRTRELLPGESNAPRRDSTDTNNVPFIQPSGPVGANLGLQIQGAGRRWLTIFEQLDIPLKRGVYVVKAVLDIQMTTDGNMTDELYAGFRYGSNQVWYNGTGWQPLAPWQNGKEFFQYIYAPEDTTIDFIFELWSKWGGTLGAGVYVRSITLESVTLTSPATGFNLKTHLVGTIPVMDDPDPEPTPSFDWRGLLLLTLAILAGIGGAWYLFTHHIQQSIGVYAMQPDPVLVDVWNVLANLPIFQVVAFGLPVVYYLMEVWKRLIDPRIPMPPQDETWGKILGFFIKPAPVALFIVLVFILTGSYHLAGTLGHGETFQQVAQFIVDLINSVGQYLFVTLGAQVMGSRFYDHYRAKGAVGFNAPSVKRGDDSSIPF